MSILSRIGYLTRTVAIMAPFGILTVPLSSAPLSYDIGAVCAPASTPVGQTGFPAACSSATAEASVTPTITYFANGFTLAIDERGFATSANGQVAGFEIFADVPVDINIAGPSRPIVMVNTYSSQSENLAYPAGTVGNVQFGLLHHAVITKKADGTEAQNFSYSYLSDPRTTNVISGPDFSSVNGFIDGFTFSVELDAFITSGNLAASFNETNTYYFFENDGVTPVSLVAPVPVAPVPEPSSALLLCAAFPLAYFVQRRLRSVADAE